MAGDKTYITDGQGKLHRATRVHAVTPTDIVWSSNPNDYTVQVKIDGKWHRAVLTMDAGSSTFFDNINIDKGLVIGSDGKQHTALIVKPESTVTLSDIKTDTHGIIAGTTTGETAVSTYSENWSDVKWQDNVNVYKVLVTGSDGKVHTALLTTSAGGGVQVIVLGTSPLNLPDAIANSLQYVKAFGGTEQNGTPTPDAPVDIVSNNGVLKARHQSGLPLGYTALEYIQSSGTQYIDTGLKLTQDDTVEVEYNYHTVSNISTSGRMFGARYTSVPRRSFSVGSNTGYASSATATFAQFDNTSGAALNNIVIGQWDVYKLSADGFYINGVRQVASFPTTTFETPFTVKLFAFEQASSSSGTPSVGCGVGQCRRFKVYQGDTLAMDLIPAKNPTNDIGMYDLVSGQFFTNAGTGDFVAGATVSDPVKIYADGTVETINAHGKNLFDKNTMDTGHGWYLNSSNVVADGSSLRTIVIDCKPNTKYSFWHTAGVGQAGAFVMDTNTIQTGDAGTLMTQSSSSTVNANIVLTTYTTPANAKKLYIVAGNTSNGRSIDDQLADLMVVEGTVATATTYEPYYDGGTATAEMLLKVDDYEDVQSIIDGVVTRNVGVYVFDGTESFVKGSAFYTTNTSFLPSKAGSITPICTHFKGIASSTSRVSDSLTMTVNGPISGVYTGCVYFYANRSLYATAADFKAYLAGQYNAGTPVIVVYPLATPTTESVAGQTLQVTDGDNYLEITQAGMDGLELEAQYNAAVSLTIQEVQDANLDNNVTVIIQ